MERCRTGPQRIKAQMPTASLVAHKTGTLYNTSSDVGIVTGPDGHAIALAIYVTGQGGNHQYRFEKIATHRPGGLRRLPGAAARKSGQRQLRPRRRPRH